MKKIIFLLLFMPLTMKAQTVLVDTPSGCFYSLLNPIQIAGYTPDTYVTRLMLGKFSQQSANTINIPYMFQYMSNPISKQWENYYQGRITVTLPGNVSFDSDKVNIFRYLQGGGTYNGYDGYIGFQFTYQ